MNIIKPSMLLTLLVAMLLLNSCEKEPNGKVVHINKESYTPSEQNEIGINIQSIISENPSEFPILDKMANSEIYNYLQQVMNSVSNTPHVENRTTFDWQINILHNDNNTSAFATPGGQVYIYTGLLKYIETESELVAIMGHEIKYVDDESLINRLSTVHGGDVLGDVMLGYRSEEVKELVTGLKDVTYTTNEVMEADNFAVKIVCEFNYDPYGIKNILERADSLSVELNWIETRPSADNRLDNIVLHASSCTNEETFAERYISFRNTLP